MVRNRQIAKEVHSFIAGRKIIRNAWAWLVPHQYEPPSPFFETCLQEVPRSKNAIVESLCNPYWFPCNQRQSPRKWTTWFGDLGSLILWRTFTYPSIPCSYRRLRLVHLLDANIANGSHVFYLFLLTRWKLKRTTPKNPKNLSEWKNVLPIGPFPVGHFAMIGFP